jgi:hypothetical protein
VRGISAMAATAPGPDSPGAHEALHDTLVTVKAELDAVDAELARRRQRERRAWADEEPALQARARGSACQLCSNALKCRLLSGSLFTSIAP